MRGVNTGPNATMQPYLGWKSNAPLQQRQRCNVSGIRTIHQDVGDNVNADAVTSLSMKSIITIYAPAVTLR